MNKLFKKVLYNLTRPYAKKHLTGNLGKVVEDDEKITCYVKKSKVKKEKYNYTIACFGIRDEQKKVAEVYKLNKPICYVIDGLDFKKHKVYIFGYDDCEVIIKNCNFEFDLSLHVNGKCTLDNTNITTFSYLSIGANELIIKNMNKEQIEVISSKSSIYFNANDKIEVINSNIGTQKEDIKISFFATNELDIVDSNISSKEVICISDKIFVNENSSLNAKNKVALKTDNFNSININSPIIVLNEKEIKNEKSSVVLKNNESLTQKRLELVNLLKKVKTQCENINTEKILEYKNELSIKPISKILKR